MIRYTRLKGLWCWPIAVLFVLLPAVLHAQSITDPRRVEFTPSADHTAVDGSGNPIVQSYSLQIYLSGGSTPIVTVPLGKPALDTDGMIRVDFVSLLSTPLTGGIVYEGRVSAIGPGGSSTSLPSNTFSFTAPCAPTISPTSQNVAAGGGSASTTVTAGTGCGWTATSNNTSWITVSTGASGSGNGTVTVSVGANGSSSSRSGTVTVAGSTFTINQAGLTCNDTISPTSKAFAIGGESVDVGVTAPAGCTWTASSSIGWLAVSTGGGSGNGTVTVTAAANTGTASRSGSVTIAGRTFNATQAGISCNDTISPGAKAFATDGEAINVAVTAPSGCGWSATSSASWLMVTAGASGSGNGTVTLSATANSAGTARSTTVTIAGNTFNASQAGVPCTDTISPGSKAFDVDGESMN
ncbi:MAG TPA: BACON domain-containing carbohydrate-binding protein, partial [Vicinamibacterales bacterium]